MTSLRTTFEALVACAMHSVAHDHLAIRRIDLVSVQTVEGSALAFHLHPVS